MMTREEAFPELFADVDSDIDDWRDESDFEPSSSEDWETGDSDEGSEQDSIEPEQQQQNAHGYGRELLRVTVEVEEEVVGEEDGEIVLDSHQQHRKHYWKQSGRMSVENLKFHLFLQRRESRWHFLMTQKQVTS